MRDSGWLSELVVCDDVRGDPLSYRENGTYGFPGVLTNVIVILVLHRSKLCTYVCEKPPEQTSTKLSAVSLPKIGTIVWPVRRSICLPSGHHSLFVIAGVGNASGTGAAAPLVCARV